MNKLQMVGFDARELWLDIPSQWNEEMRGKRLLATGSVKPLSVDDHIWYSIFTEKTRPHIWENKMLQAKYYAEEWQSTFSNDNKLEVPDLYQPRRVWTNLDSLTGYLNQSWQQDWKPCAIIAIQEITLADETHSAELRVEPESAGEDWKLLGYDIADYELYSGLCEGEITDKLSSQIKPEWKENLNNFHLFTNPDVALDYISFANARNPSHMPYHVYALYLVQTVRAELPK